MGEAIFGAVVATGMILFVAVALIIGMKIFNAVQDNRVKAWTKAGARFGLRFENEPTSDDLSIIDKRLTGEFSGCALTLEITQGQLNSNTISTRGELVFPSMLPFELRIERKGLLTMMKSSVETGDADFDALFAVKTDTPEGALRVLTSSVRSALIELGGLVSGLVMTPRNVVWREHSGLYDGERLENTLAAMQRVAEALHASTQGLAEGRAEAFTGVTLPERAEVEVAAPAPAHAAAARKR